jgi:hypothetical protein
MTMCRTHATRLGLALVLTLFGFLLSTQPVEAQTICQVCREGCDLELQACVDAGGDPVDCFAQFKVCRRGCNRVCNRTLASTPAAAPVTPALVSQAKVIGPILPDPECLAACDAENESCLAAGLPPIDCARANQRCRRRCVIFPGGF